jgi:lipoate-protein ligase A
MLWQNDNAIIIGKYQNTIEEINCKFIDEHMIKVVRRNSGGGAVYHDLGNLNFSFIVEPQRSEFLDFSFFIKPVINTLGKIGIHAEFTGRNDITVNGKKISGNSQYIKNGRVLQLILQFWLYSHQISLALICS